MPTPQEAAANPKFRALSPQSQAKVMSALSPSFASLAPDSQQRVLASLTGGQPAEAPPRIGAEGASGIRQSTFMERPLVAGVSPQDVLDVGIGAAKSVPNAVLNLGEMFREGLKDRGPSYMGPIPPPAEMKFPARQEGLTPEERTAFQPETWGTEPTNAAQELGQTAGQIGQFAMAGEATAPAWLAQLMAGSRLARGAGEGAKVAAVSAAQEGIDPQSALLNFLLGGAVGQAAKAPKIVSGPFAGKVDPRVMSAAARQGVEMPASAVSTSPFVPLAESWAAKGPFSGPVAERITRAMSDLDELAQKTVQQSKVSDPTLAGKLVIQSVDDFKSAFIKAKEQMYSAVEIPAGIKKVPEETIALLDDIIEQKTVANSPDLGQFSKMRAALTGEAKAAAEGAQRDLRGERHILGEVAQRNNPYLSAAERRPKAQPLDLHDLRTVAKEWNARFANSSDPIVRGNPALIERLQATFRDEFEGFLGEVDPAALKALKAANKHFTDTHIMVDAALGQSFERLRDKPDKLLEALVKPSMSATNIPRFEQILSPEALDAARGAVIGKIIMGAKGAQPGTLTPGGIQKGMRAWGDKLKSLLTPEQYAKLEDLSTLTLAMQKGQRIAEGSQTMFLGRVAAYSGGVGSGSAAAAAGGGMLPLVLAFGGIAGDAAVSRFLGSKAGQRWLTEGFGPMGVSSLRRSVAEGAMSKFIGGAKEQ